MTQDEIGTTALMIPALPNDSDLVEVKIRPGGARPPPGVGREPAAGGHP